MRKYIYSLALAGSMIGSANLAHASVSLLNTDQWKVNLGGFIEVDSITDTTRSFDETIGNRAVSRDVQNGHTGRNQLSIRNSRLAFTILAPEYEGWKSKGYFEFDLQGFDPSSGTSGNTEAGFYNNPTLRLRHGFMQVSKESWDLMAGQYWNLLGWQPYYFVPTVQVAPIPAMLYGRTAQVRATKGFDFSDEAHAQLALGIMRPPQRDAGLPGLETGLRFAYDGWTGGFTPGSTAPQKAMPASIAVSGAVREFEVASTIASPTADETHYTGHSLAVDAFLPILAAHDKDVSNSFSLGGEFTTGTGDGDEFNGWTGGMVNPLNSAAAAPNKNVNLDGGIGGFDASSNFQLVDVKTFNLYGQYHLPAHCRAWISGGYGRLYSDNIGGVSASWTSATAPYNREQVAFGNIMKDFTDQFRMGFEFAQIRTTYLDGTVALNNRYQLSAFFIF